MITMQGKYQTRDGRAVRILCVDGPWEEYPIVGFVKGETPSYSWTATGIASRSICYPMENLDLIPAPEGHDGWCAVSRNPLWTGHTDIRTDYETARKDMLAQAWSDIRRDWTVAHVTWEE